MFLSILKLKILIEYFIVVSIYMIHDHKKRLGSL